MIGVKLFVSAISSAIFMDGTKAGMTTYTNIVKIKFIVPALCVRVKREVRQ